MADLVVILRNLKQRFLRVIAPPRFADPETDRISRSAHTCAVTLIGVMAVWTPTAFMFQTRDGVILLVGLGSICVLAGAAAAARAGRGAIGAGVIVSLIFGTGTFGLWTEGGVLGTSTGSFLAVVLAASLFFSSRAAWATAGLSVLTLLLFWQLELAGFLPARVPYGPERVLISTFTVMAIMVALVQLNVGRIRESQRFLREVTDASPHALYVYDMVEGKVAYSNAATREQLGYSALPADDPELFRFVVHPDDRRVLADHARRAAEAGDDEIIECDYRGRHRDGGWRTIRDRSRVFHRLPDGSVRQILGVAEDVTNEREAQRALEESRERLQRVDRLEALGQLAGGIAHDFNNYLTVIIGATEEAEHRAGDDEELRELITDALSAAERSADLTRQLLGFSKHRLMQPRVFDLNLLLTDSERLLRRVVPENVEIDILTSAGMAPILADPSQLEQVVLNLAVNARDAMPEGGRITIRTEVVTQDRSVAPSLVHADSHVLLSVSDTGCGMDAATKAQIFEPLFTTKGAGTGFGLATVDAVIRQSDGAIEVDSNVGAGSCFRIYLPLAEGELDNVDAPVEPPASPGGEHVLLVEDDEMVRRFTRRILEASGYRVTEARDGSAGRVLFEECSENFDLLLTDIMLPGLSGLELAAALRESRPGLPLVFMSGYAANELTAHGLGSKEHLIHKPFSQTELQQQIREALDEA